MDSWTSDSNGTTGESDLQFSAWHDQEISRTYLEETRRVEQVFARLTWFARPVSIDGTDDAVRTSITVNTSQMEQLKNEAYE